MPGAVERMERKANMSCHDECSCSHGSDGSSLVDSELTSQSLTASATSTGHDISGQTAAAGSSLQSVPSGFVKRSFQIQGLDCQDEVALLRKSIGQLQGETKLEFNLLQGEMVVAFDPALIDPAELETAIHQTGLKVLRQEASTSTTEQPATNPKRLLGRQWLLPSFTAAFIVAGLATSAWRLGSLLSAFQVETAVFQAEAWTGLQLVSTIGYLIAISMSLVVVLPRALRSLKMTRMDMHVLMLLAAIGAIVIGQLLEGAMVLWLFTVSLALETSVVAHARQQISSLLTFTPTSAMKWSKEADSWNETPVHDVRPGDRLLIKPGERLPVDGVVIEGESSVEESMLTGEPLPLDKTKDSKVLAGSINGSGSLVILAATDASQSTFSQIVRLVQQAQSQRSRFELRVEKFAGVYTPAMIGLAIIVFVASWLLWQLPIGRAVHNGLVLLVIACPCALVIATPIAMVSAITALAKRGVLVKGASHLETLAQFRAMAIDKTGTLTSGELNVVHCDNNSSEEIQAIAEIANALSEQSQHPVSIAIQRWANERADKTRSVESLQSRAGKGLDGIVEGKRFCLGNKRLAQEVMLEENVRAESMTHIKSSPDRDLDSSIQVFLFDESSILATFHLEDTVRPEIKQQLTRLRQSGIDRIVMLTGDRLAVAQAVADQLGIDDVRADLLPDDKLKFVRELQDSGELVAMVGDGINDGPALAAADISIAIGKKGSDLATETADIVLLNDSLEQLPSSVSWSRRALRIVTENIVIALFLKAFFAALVWLDWGALWMAVAADAGAALVVVANSLRLLKR